MTARTRVNNGRSIRAPSSRGLPDGAIALVTSAGLIGGTMIGLFAPGYWKGGLLFAAMAGFGALEIFDRSIFGPRWLYRLIKTFVMIGSWLAAFALLFLAFEVVLRSLKS